MKSSNIKRNFCIFNYTIDKIIEHTNLINNFDKEYVFGWFQEYVNFIYRGNSITWEVLKNNIDVLSEDRLDIEFECYCNKLDSIDNNELKIIIKNSLFSAKKVGKEMLNNAILWGVSQLKNVGADVEKLMIDKSWVVISGIKILGIKVDMMSDKVRRPILFSSEKFGRFVYLGD